MITIVTPTGDRPLAFALCQHWMMNQTVKPDQWIVVDDGKTPMRPFVPMEYVRRGSQGRSMVRPTMNSSHMLTSANRMAKIKAIRAHQQRIPSAGWVSIYSNLRAAIPLIQGDKIIFIEDDEYYAPDYIEQMAALMDKYDLVGIKHSRYYHLPSGGYKIFTSQAHASLAQTAFRGSFLPIFQEFLGVGRCAEFLDVRLWTQHRSMRESTINKLKINCRGFLFLDDPPLYVGMKGLPGRGGYGVGHKPHAYAHHDGPDRVTLKKWIPKDAEIYLDILNGKLTGENYESYLSSRV